MGLTTLFSEAMAKIEATYQQWDVPGISVGLVTKDGLQAFQSLGYANISLRQTAGINTLHCVASTSKAFTTTLLGMLRDEGRLQFSDPIKLHIPEFTMLDSYVAEHLTIQDVYAHMSGIADNELAWIQHNVTDTSILDLFAHAKFSHPFRSKWEYSNWNYALLGLVIERVTGVEFSTYAKKKILDPLGMKDATFILADAKQNSNFAIGYQKTNGDFTTIPYLEMTKLGASGGLCISMADMAIWMAFHINNGNHLGKQLISEESLALLKTPAAICDRGHGDKALTGYAAGWIIEAYKGKKFIAHTGGIDGFTTYLTYCPEEEAGIIVFTNKDNDMYLHPATYTILDTLYKLEPTDWFSIYQKRKEKNQQLHHEKIEGYKDMVTDIPLHSTHYNNYRGYYHNKAYGTILVAYVERKLTIQIGAIVFDTYFFSPTTFYIKTKNPSLTTFTALGEFKKNGSLVLDLEPTLEESIIFLKN